ncbi:MAG: 2-amino-4-hydroxy-6-hydroxymethyldihydropteridine diphosphokinase [Deltaproteobacteria bacterium]|nr:2-amino-4-hydroxy-6-hydroxymethyldihydropteridine diphosphokinase [Deltaproteobacteria bacterium]
MERVFISIGSNAGDRLANCRRVVGQLRGTGGLRVVRRSSFYLTRPWGRPGQMEFVNCAIEVKTALRPEELLKFLNAVEKTMGIRQGPRWGPRVIDLDIIFYGDRVKHGRFLKLPHPCAHQRAFVMSPLSEIAPEFMHPLLGKKVSDIAAELGNEGVRIIDRPPHLNPQQGKD